MKRYFAGIAIVALASLPLQAERMSRTKTYALNPTIAVAAATEQEIDELELIRTRIRDWFSGPNSKLSNSEADDSYNKLDSGSTALTYAEVLFHYALDYVKNGKNSSLNKAITIAETIHDNGLSVGFDPKAPNDYKRGYVTRKYWEGLSLIIEHVEDDVLRRDLVESIKYLYYINMQWSTEWGETQELNSDFVHNTMRSVLGMIALGTKDNDEAVRAVKGFKRLLDIGNDPAAGQLNWIKPDGVSYHHHAHHQHYMYAISSYCDVLDVLRGTQFQIGKTSYLKFRDMVYASMLLCHENSDYAMSLCGRTPFKCHSTVKKAALKKLINVGGQFSDGSSDPLLAGEYNRIYDDNSDLKSEYGMREFPQGFWQFNWSPIAIIRGDNWVVTAHGINDSLWGSEIIGNDNLYGRYQSYGTLEVMYDGGLSGSGHKKDNWDFSLFPGTTTKYLPKSEINPNNAKEEFAASGSRFAGALRFQELTPDYENSGILDYGRVGMYGNDFKQDGSLSATHDSSFKFKKSYFFVDDYIICLGSNISCDDADNKIVTTLYQGTLENSDSPMTVNGASLTSSDEQTLTGSDNWIVDAYGTGYHIVSDADSVDMKRTGSRAYAYINHGPAPSGARYEYLVKPGTTDVEMEAFNQTMVSSKPYEVVEQKSSVHFVKLKDGIEAYNLFKTNTDLQNGVVKENTKPCMIMAQSVAGRLKMTLVNPDLGHVKNQETNSEPITLQVTLNGIWKVVELDAGITVVGGTDSTTTFSFVTKDGEPYDMILEPADSIDVPKPPVTVVETFENMTHTGWGTETITGSNGVEWSLDGNGEASGRIDSSKSIYFGAGKTGAASGTITGGISSFSVKCKDLWNSGDERTLELLINGNVIAVKKHTGTEIYTFTVENINIEGDITIAIRNASQTNAKVAIDNLTWTSYAASTTDALITLKSGYQIISLNVVPAETNIETMFSSVLDDHIEFVMDQDGKRLYKRAGAWVNEIEHWDSSQAYIVKAKGAVSFNVPSSGVSVFDNDLPGSDTYLVPTRTSSPDASLDYFSSIIDRVEWIRDIDGNSLRKVNGRWVNSIKKIETGSGVVVRTKP